MMPVMDGYELVRRLRESDNHIPVMMITAKDAFDDMRRGFISGTDDYMIKHVTVNGKVARASYDVKVNDVLELQLGARAVKARVVSVNEYAKKDEAALMYEVIEEK